MKRMHLSLDFVPIPSFCDSRFQHRSDRPSMCSSSRRSYPLSGVTVVEAGTFLAASLTTLHLQHLGATVIAIQPPAGSHERAEEQWRPATRAALTEVEREREREREREKERERERISRPCGFPIILSHLFLCSNAPTSIRPCKRLNPIRTVFRPLLFPRALSARPFKPLSRPLAFPVSGSGGERGSQLGLLRVSAG